MALVKIEPNTNVKLEGKTIFQAPSENSGGGEEGNAIQFNGQNLQYNGETLTFTE
jgi:hypothetical protein